jgi:hypothetical protein
MTDTPKVPREWTISKYLQLIERTGGPPGNQIISFVNGPDCTDVNVIEHSAYQSAVDALEQEKICSARIFSDAGKLTKERDQALERAAGLVSALEVYAATNETFPEYGDVARQALKDWVSRAEAFTSPPRFEK